MSANGSIHSGLQGILAKTAAKREERVADLHLDLPVPTWDGDLIARFGILDRDDPDLDKLNGAKRTTQVDIQVLIKSVDSLWLRDPERMFPEGIRMKDNEDFVRLDDEKTGLPVKFDQTLATMLGVNLDTAVNVVLYVFKNNGIAIGGFVSRLQIWMQNTDAKVSQDLLGE